MQTQQLRISAHLHKLIRRMLSGQEIDIFSSFGPFGRSKVIENVHGGSRVVTKDGQQILECCLSDPRSQNSLHRTLLKMCCSVSEEYGDGSLTTLMIASHIVARLGTLAGGDSNSCIQWVLLLQALETICSTIEALKVDINTHMTDSQIWTNSNEDESATSTSIMKTSGYLKGLWGTILQPATNTATAAKIEDVINKWIVSDCKNIQIIAEKCRFILENWDEHVIISTTGQSLEDSYCVPQNTVIIEGRCRDFTAFRTRKSSIKNGNSDANHDLNTDYRFGLLKSFTPLTAVASITQNVTIQINSLSDLNAVEGLNLFSAKDSFHTKQLLDYLRKNDVSALFCADSVSDDLIYSVALTGVVLVDRVPTASLQRLSKISNSTLWDSSSDLLNHCGGKDLPSWGIFTGLDRVTYGKKSDIYYKIQNVKNLSNVQKRSEGFYGSDDSVFSRGNLMENTPSKNAVESSNKKFDNFDENSSMENEVLGSAEVRKEKEGENILDGDQGEGEGQEGEGGVESVMARQLVLQSNSIISSNIYCRLIKRCLRAAIKVADDAVISNSRRGTAFAAPSSSSSSSSSSTSSSSHPSFPSSSSIPTFPPPSSSQSNSFLRSPSCRNSSKINEIASNWVPGGGAAEMGWSALWGSISTILTTRLNSQFNANFICDNNNRGISNNVNKSDNENRGNNSYCKINNNNYKNNENDTNLSDKIHGKCSASFEEEQRSNKSFQTIIRPIAERITDQIVSKILNSHGLYTKFKESKLNSKGNTIYFNTVRTCIQMCTLLSDAYLQVPRSILYNAQTTHNNGRSRTSKKSELLWKLWRSHYESGERVEELKDYTGGTGRLGLIVPHKRGRKDDDYPSYIVDPLCTLSDAIPAPVRTASVQETTIYPVVMSLSLFWKVFSTVTACCNLFLRIGGSDGVILVKRLQGSERRDRTFVTRSAKRKDDSSDEESDTDEKDGFEDED